MKKFTTAKLLAAFCVLLLNISLKSQTNITIGDMNTAYISEKYPFDNFYNYSWSNVIYLSSEIGQGGKITQIAFYVYQGNTISMASQKILMRETSATGYTSSTYPGETGFTTVFNGTISYNFSGTSGWQVITLSTPFTYSGTSNLEVLFENNSGAYTNNFEYFYTTTGYSSNRVRRDYNDASFPSSCVNCGAFANIPNTQLTMVCTSTVSISPSSPAVCNGSSTTLTASGASSYSWSPTTGLSSGTGASVTASPSSTTNYVVTAQDASSCVQTKTVTVTVNALPTISISPSSPSICSGGSTTLTASGASTYTWSPTTGLSASTGASVTANPSSTTTYSVTGTNSNGCVKTQTVTVTVNTPSTLTFSPSAPAICIGSTTTVTASGASTYSWSPSIGLNTTTGATVAANPTTTTTYSINYTSSNSCVGSTTLSVVVNPLPTLTLSPSSPAVCNGSSTTITASGASTYSWSPATNLSATTGASVNANPTTATNYTLTGTNANGCVNTKAFTVNVNGLPTISVSPTSATICVGNNTSLTASGASTYSWTPSSSLNNANSANVTASPNATTTYTVSGTNGNGCVGTTTVTVNVNPLPTINVTASPTAICVGASSNLSASGANTYSWSPATGLNNTNTANVTANPTSTTNYTVSGTNANGCIGNQTINLVVNPLPSISISPSSPVVLGGQGATITANGASTYSWSPSTNLSSTSGSTVTANPEITTAYTLTGTSAAGCVNQTAFSVGIELWQQVADSAKAPIFYQGNVGINNNNPQAALDVIGNEKLSGNLSVGGTITDPSFGGGGNRILQTDNAGVITPISSGTSAQVLYGNGTWGALPTEPIQTSGTNAYFTGGNFGIGNVNPAFPLDVTGNARITGVLTAGGINSSSSNLDVTTPAVFTSSVTVASLNVNGTATVNQLNIAETISSPKLVTSRITYPDTNGLHIGDSSVYINTILSSGSNPSYDLIYSNFSRLAIGRFSVAAYGPNSMAIGMTGTETDAKNSMAIGYDVKTANTATNSIAFGSGYVSGGSSHPMVNTTPFSLAVGFNSDVPTLFVSGGNGTSGSIGKVGIGTTSPNAVLHVNTQNTGNSPGLIVDNANPSEAPPEFIVNSDGSLAIYDNLPTNGDILNINTQAAPAQSGASNTIYNHFRITGNGYVGIGSKLTNYDNEPPQNNVSAYKMLTVNGDVSLANYNTGTGNQTDGLNGIEILGGNKVPSRRGISTDDDPNGDFNFYVNSYQSPSGNLAEFNFKNGIDPSTNTPAQDAAHAPTLMKLDQNGVLTLNSYSLSTATTNRSLSVDQNGKVIADVIGANGSAWLLGGNAENNIGTNGKAIGTTDNSDMPFLTNNQERMRITSSGNIAIISGDQILLNGYSDLNHGLGYFDNSSGFGGTHIDGPVLYGYSGGALGVNQSGTKNVVLGWLANGQTTITSNGATDAFIIQDALSSNVVNFKVKTTGQVYAREVIVKNGAFPDYVFAKEYNLMPLGEVKKYIETNHHLPNMPTASEVEKNGANLGEIQRVSVEKIEELTLYMIEMKKEIETLKKENAELKAAFKK